MCGALRRDWWRGNMCKAISSTPSSGFKGLQPLVATNLYQYPYPSLRGSVRNVLSVHQVHRCCIPEAISVHQTTDENLSQLSLTPLHRKLRAGRLPRRSFPAKDTIGFISKQCNAKTLLAMTNKNGFRVQDNKNSKIQDHLSTFPSF
jgi:hypothetical protein